MSRRSYTSAGRQQDVPALDFELDGVTFVGEGDISVMDMSEYARLATQGVDSESPEGVAILADVYKGLLGDRVYNRFRMHCRKHGTDGETLVTILQDLISAAADRPTGRPSDSSDGPQTAPATVTAVSFSRGTVEQVAAKQEPQLVSYG
ncbi:hypothetical protein ACLQ2R_17260 [Streptosporangium sp. DT93]|uniref:hypothetical protein n=1 Tax=Streptosporangium sp. DT93 TaxID=3393428 RepID=UPI003CF125A4